MEAYYTVFDRPNKRVGFAPSRGCEVDGAGDGSDDGIGGQHSGSNGGGDGGDSGDAREASGGIRIVPCADIEFEGQVLDNAYLGGTVSSRGDTPRSQSRTQSQCIVFPTPDPMGSPPEAMQRYLQGSCEVQGGKVLA